MAETGRVYPVIMCGGSGSRLWPLSRQSCPKQFSPLFDGDTLFQRTLGRLAGQGHADPLLLTNEAFRFIVAEQMDAVGASATRIVVEPDGRGTAPAICAAARMVAEIDPDGVLLVLPSDHLIADVEAFGEATQTAVAAARRGDLVTFGIRPDRAETGYGYIELAAAGEGGPQPFVRFVEKPDADAAAGMLATGRFLWNSGMFVFTARAILDALARLAPKVDAAIAGAIAAGREDLFFFRLEAEAYGRSPDTSIDYAIMEHVAGTVVPVDCGWNDLGTWLTVWRETPRDGDGVAAGDNTLAIDCAASLLRSEHPEIQLVGIGLRNIAAIATRDAVLVADMDHIQDVRRAVEMLKARGVAQATELPRCFRPWGWYESLVVGEGFQVKQIMVKPGGQLSLQSHVDRSEHWVVVAGSARVTVGDDIQILEVNQSAYIPLGAIHRLENPGELDLHLIEVQSGGYLGEDDIVRYEDVYARD